MDNMDNLNIMIKNVRKFCDDRDWGQYHNAKDLAILISIESSELLEIFRFKSLKEVNDFK